MPYKDKEKMRKWHREKMRYYRETNPSYLEKGRIRMRLIRENNPEYVQKEREANRIRFKEIMSNPINKEKVNQYNRNRRKSRKQYCFENKICFNRSMSCKEQAISTHTMCEYHIFEEYAHRHLKNDSRWKELSDLFYSQNQLCYLSGKKLVLGVNASLDHIVPTSKGGSFDDIKNLAWMDSDINYAKNNLSNEELIVMCNIVAKKHPRTILD